jgi:predicted O-methyltransferase YrrM
MTAHHDRESLRSYVEKLTELAAGSHANLAKALAPLLTTLLSEPQRGEVFRALEEEGIHLRSNSFYDPIPDTRELASHSFTDGPALETLDFRREAQLQLLESFGSLKEELDRIPREPTNEFEFFLGNGSFDETDALILYSMIRHFRPRRMIEVGCGNSTLLAAQAGRMNGGLDLTCIEPFPSPKLEAGIPGVTRFLREKVQDVPLDVFSELGENDILFIDSSHVSKCGSDVNYLYLRVLPRLAPGVIVHAHDIFLPFEYLKEWVLGLHIFWNEQYLLQAFLTGNRDWEIVMSNCYLGRTARAEMQRVFPTAKWHGGGSFWIRRVAK